MSTDPEQPDSEATSGNPVDDSSKSTQPTEAWNTAFAPSMPTPIEGRPPQPHSATPELPQVGQRIDDFELLAELGRGAVGVVFLARQVSLDRRVALKVSANVGAEGRTMASLEHRNIVQVFAEVVDRERNLRLLCMQFVPGTTLEDVLDRFVKTESHSLTGANVLNLVDRTSAAPPLLDPSAIRDRQLLESSDACETVCLLGLRLAEALAYAHAQGVLHRDIKPANILVDQYGQPLLADFNLSAREVAGSDPVHAMFGGTLAYMAPEHLDAFNPARPTSPAAVDARSDLYSLGVVLYEILCRQRPFQSPPSTDQSAAALTEMARSRREGPPPIRPDALEVPLALRHAIETCLEPDPSDRYASADTLVGALRGCHALGNTIQRLPPAGRLTRAMFRRPFLWAVLLTLVPHLLGSLVNISYNALMIASSLTESQQEWFRGTVGIYNLIVYPLCLGFLAHVTIPVWRTWRRLHVADRVAPEDVDAARQRVARWPAYCVALACIGWLPGGVLFPAVLHYASGPIGAAVFGHFFVSFTLSGLIAITYSFFGIAYVTLRVFYPQLWCHAENSREVAKHELASTTRLVGVTQVLAGLIPLSGAALLVGVGPREFEGSGYQAYQMLVLVLLALGLAGFQSALAVTAKLRQTMAAWD